MSWNNGYETKKFKEEQRKIEIFYRECGVSEEFIQVMYEFSRKQFCEERTYREHTEPFTESHNITTENAFEFYSRYWWIEEISDPSLAQKLKSLSDDDIELLTLYTMLGYTYEEIAHMKGCTKQNIQKKIQRIKNFLK